MAAEWGRGGMKAFIRGDLITIPFEKCPMCEAVHRKVCGYVINYVSAPHTPSHQSEALKQPIWSHKW